MQKVIQTEHDNVKKIEDDNVPIYVNNKHYSNMSIKYRVKKKKESEHVKIPYSNTIQKEYSHVIKGREVLVRYISKQLDIKKKNITLNTEYYMETNRLEVIGSINIDMTPKYYKKWLSRKRDESINDLLKEEK